MKQPRILTVGIATLFALPITVTATDRNWTGGGVPGTWGDAANWDTGVPTTDTGDNIFVRLTDSVTGDAINASSLYLGTGTPGVPTSGFTFGAGVFNIGFIAVGDGHNGANPTSNRFARAFINAGTTVNAAIFFVGEWDGGTGQVLQNGGALHVSGQFRVGHWPQADVGAGTASSYTLNAGTITVSGDPADPFDESQQGNVYLGVDSTGILIINGGTFTSKGLALDNRAATGGRDRLEINGGILNVGANGIVSQNAGSPSTYEVRLGGGTVRATANWTSNLETTLVTGGTGIQYDTNGKIVTLSGDLVGTGGLTKIGAGTLKLSGTNSFSGGLTVNAGRVQIGDGGPTGSAGLGAVVVNSAGELAYNRTDALTVSGAVSGTGTLCVNSGTLRFANVSGSISPTVVSGATLGASGMFSSVVANSGSSLEAGVAGVGSFTTDSLFLFGSTLKVSAGTSNTRFNVTSPGGLLATGSNVFQIAPVNLTTGTYTLLDYAGSLSPGFFSTFSLTGLPRRAVGGLVNNTGNTSIDLSISSIDNPKWSGGIDGNWDVETQNWKLIIDGGPTTYQNLDGVLFDDTATGTTEVLLTAAFTPSSVTFNNDAKTYSLAGPGAISGGTGVTKQGPGRVIVTNTANDYSGPTDVQAGTLQIGDGISGTVGTGTTVTIGAAGTVELNLAAAANYATPTTGPGTVRTLGVNSFNLAAGVLAGTPELNIAGDLAQVIGGNNQPAFAGLTNITSGTLRALGAQALGTTAGVTVISDDGTLDVNALDLGAEQVFVSGNGVFGNGAIVNNGGGTAFNLHKVTLTGDASFGGTGRWDMRTTGIPGELLDLAGHKLTKVGPNQVSLVEVNATEGDIDINGGVFSIEDQSQVQGAGTITLNPGGALGLWINQPGRLTRNIVAKGGGIIELGSGGLTTVDSPISLQANLAINVGGGNTVLNYVGNIVESGGPFALHKDGDGRLVLLGNNAWTGGFNVNAGVLQVGNGGTAGTLGTGTSSVSSVLVFAKTSASTIAGDINPGGPAGTLILVADGAVTLASGTDVKISSLQAGVNGQDNTLGGTLNIGPGTSLIVQDSVIIGNTAGGGLVAHGIIHQTGGTVDVNAPNTDGRNFVLGHWNQGQGTYDLSAGTLNSPNISMTVSWDGTGAFKLSGTGVASLKGLRFGNHYNNGTNGAFDLTGGELNLGDEGIWATLLNRPTDINLGGGTVRALAAKVPITLPAEFTGINGDATFDTNGNTINVTGDLSGAGGLMKVGAGKLLIQGVANFAALTTVAGRTDLVQTLGSGTSTIDAGAETHLASSQTLADLTIGPGGLVTLGPLPAGAPDFAGDLPPDAASPAVQAVPEPGSIGLLILGTAGLLGRRTRRRAAKS